MAEGDNQNNKPGDDLTFSDLHKVEPTSLVGKIIDGKYKVISLIGSGGMGVVYRAEHTFMNRAVAIKVLHTHLASSTEFISRFKHEAQVASKLRHNNVVIIFDFGVYENQPYLVMELVEGTSLKSVIEQGGALPLERVTSICSQVCSALSEAHALGIVHRDLKPDNIILSRRPDGSELTQVLDFGLAKIIHADDSLATVKTQVGMFFGTPKYASPEQALSKELDGRSDIYSLGVILYEAISGNVPFDAPSVMETLMKHINQAPQPLKQFKPELNIPAAVDQIILKCLEKEPSARYQSARELREALESTSATLKNNTVSVETIRPQRRGGLGIFLGIIGALLLILVVVVFQISKSISGSDEEPSLAATVTRTPEPVTLLEVPSTPTPPPPMATQPTVTQTVVSDNELLPVETETPHTSPATTPTEVIETPAATPLPTIVPSTPLATPATTPIPAATTPQPTPAALDPLEREQLARSFFERGSAIYRRRQYSEAIPALEKAVEYRPNHLESRLNLGICYLRVGRNRQAYEQFSAAVKINPRSAEVHFNLACYYSIQGQTDQAIQELENTIRINKAARFWARGEPDLEPISNHPRFKFLVGRR